MTARFILGTAAALAALSIIAAPASAATFLLGDTASTPGDTPTAVGGSLAYTSGGIGLTLKAYTYVFNPNPLGSHDFTISPTPGSQFDPAALYRDTQGVGVCSGLRRNETSVAECSQVDTLGNGANQPNEALVATFDQSVKLTSAVVSLVNSTDTLTLWGLNTATNQLVDLQRFTPINAGGLEDNTQFTVNFAAYAGSYSTFAFSSTEDSGYRIDALNAVAVPEPATWAMMIMGFGAVGAVVRNRRRSLSAHA